MKKVISRNSIIIIIYILISIFLVIIGFLYFYYDLENLKKKKQQELITIANTKIQQILRWRNDEIAHALVLSESPFFSENIKLWMENNDSIIKKKLKKRLLIFKDAFGYTDIFITTKNAELVFSVSENTAEIDQTTENFILESGKNNEILVTDFYYCNIHKEIHYDIIAPILYDNQLSAFLVLRINPQEFIYPLIQNWPTTSKTSETLIVRRDGDYVLFLNELRHMKNTALKLRFPLTRKDIPAVEAILGKTGIFEGNDYRGIKVLAVLNKIEPNNWYLITKVDSKEIYYEIYLREILGFLIFFLIIMICGIMMSGFYFARQKKLYEKMYLNEKRLTETTTEFMTILYSIGDAVITTDKHSCIRYMNHISEKLTGWTENEAKGKNLDDIFNIVDESTLKKVANPFDKIVKTGAVIGLANHTLLISRDGNSIPISDSGAPIRNEKNEITGVVLVFRDQTEEKEIQRKLIDNEKRFRNNLDNMIEGCQIIDKELKFIYINKSAAGYWICEKEKAIGKSLLEIYPAINGTEFYDDLNNCLKENKSVLKEYEIKNMDATNGWFEISIHPSPEGLFVVLLDITERKKSEEIIRRNKELLEKTQSIARLGGWEMDSSKRISYWSDEMNKLHGIKSGYMVSVIDDYLQFIHNDDRKDFKEKIETVRTSGKTLSVIYKTNPDYCKTRIINSTIHCVKSADGRMRKLIGTCLDITEMKEAEAKIKKVLEEKDILLKELYHRTKNNMMIICSLLNLESNYFADEKVRNDLKEIENKIKSMALVHQMLYQSKSLSKINLKNYIEELSDLLIKSSKKSIRNVEIDINAMEIEVMLDTAIPFGMVLNELITNSLKYAFEEDDNGCILINLDKKSDNEIELIYSDSGAGLPSGFDIYKQTTLGMQTITNIIKNQMQGELEYYSDNGLKYMIKFKDNLYYERI